MVTRLQPYKIFTPHTISGSSNTQEHLEGSYATRINPILHISPLREQDHPTTRMNRLLTPKLDHTIESSENNKRTMKLKHDYSIKSKQLIFHNLSSVRVSITTTPNRCIPASVHTRRLPLPPSLAKNRTATSGLKKTDLDERLAWPVPQITASVGANSYHRDDLGPNTGAGK